MNYRLLKHLARFPLRQRYFADPYFYPTEMYFQPSRYSYPEYRMRDIFEEFDEMMDMLAEPEMYQTHRTHPKAIPTSTDKTQALKSSEKETNTQKAEEKESSQTIKTVEEKQPSRANYTFFGQKSTEPTFGRAQKILEQAAKDEKPTLTMDENDELLQGTEDFKDIVDYFGKNGLIYNGSTFQSSTIIKDGKVITVSKHSQLGEDGIVKTEVRQDYRDSKGQNDSRKWTKEDRIKGQLENKVEEKAESKEQPSIENAQKA